MVEMRPVTTFLQSLFLRPSGLVGLFLLMSLAVPVSASNGPAPPTSASIEKLIREALKKDEVELPSLLPLRSAALLEFRLVRLHQVSGSRWNAEIDTVFDFGPPSPFVIGFERIRRGRYRLVLMQRGKQLKLARFTPVARIHPLPVWYRR